MTKSEKLDLILNIISENNDFVSSKDLFFKTENRIEQKEVTSIINKLFADNYIEKKIIDQPNNSKLSPPYFCRLTYSGLLFVERGGFVCENKRIKLNTFWTKTKTIANILNVIIVLSLAALGVYISWDSKKKDTIIKKDQIEILNLKAELKTMKTELDTLKLK